MNKDPTKTEISEQFLKGMKDRMLMSYYKYGPVAGSQGKINYLDSLQQRLKRYKETGNTEFLMDAANFAMIEFMFPTHREAHFTPTDSDQSPGRITSRGYRSGAKRNDEL